MASLRKRGKVWYYRYVDADGVRQTARGCTDKRATEELAHAAEAKAAKIRAGLVDPKELAYRDHAARPLAEHLTAWAESLASKGATPKHIELSTGRARRIVAIIRGARLADIDPPKNTKRADLPDFEKRLAEWVAPVRLADLTAERVQQALATLRAEGRSLATCNHYRTAIKVFAKWCADTHRTRDDVLRGVKGYNAREDRRHDRRTLSLPELHRLIEAAENGPIVLGIAGPARALCYRLAVATGLRYGEIASIRPASFDWKVPSVRVAASYTKNGAEAELPLPNDLADDLKRFVATIAPGSPVWPLPRDKGADLLQADLAVAKIPYQDESGLFFDFHALRCQTATLADAAGVSPRVVQKLMRHSTLELTGRYTRPRAVDIEAAASRLPSLRPPGDRTEELAMTGTTGPRQSSDATDLDRPDPQNPGTEGPSISKDFGPLLAHAGDVSGRNLSVPDVMTRSIVPALTNEKPPVSRGLDASRRVGSATVGSTGEATRTPDLRIMRPPL